MTQTMIDKAIKLASRANKREGIPVFIHLTAYGPKLHYKHTGCYSQPVIYVHRAKCFAVDVCDNYYKFKYLFEA